MKPNIFELATKELSQDGFFTWLLLWADPSNKVYDEKLHSCAVELVKFLIREHLQEEVEAVIKIQVERQKYSIDIWAEVNDKYCIIIEDKTYTKEHSNQLEKYKNIAMERCEERNLKLVCIYLKTGTEAIAASKIIAEKGFTVIKRENLINFFKNCEKYNVANDIYLDFYDKIKNIESAEKAFSTKIIKDWDDWWCWTGFYHYLDTELKNTDWKYVPNPTGGFQGLWWCFLKWENCDVYLQIEQRNLCFKIGEIRETRADYRDRCHKIIMERAKQENKNEIIKPLRFGSGTWMTVALVEAKDWLGKDDDIINKEKVVERLKDYEQFLKRCFEAVI